VTPTQASHLIVIGIVGAGAGWVLEMVFIAMGWPIIIPPITLPVALALISIIVVSMAVPVWRFVRGTATKRVDPFYATRVVVLAKASSLAGALLAGATGAIVIFVLTRPVLPAVGSVSLTVAATVCAVLLLISGLVAEKMCTLPPEDDGTASQA